MFFQEQFIFFKNSDVKFLDRTMNKIYVLSKIQKKIFD